MLDMYRFLIKCLTCVVNLISNTFPDCSPFHQIRKVFMRLLGAEFGAGSVIYGGGYVHKGSLLVGKCVFINRGCYFDLSAPVTIDDGVTIGHGVTFITAGHEVGSQDHRAGPVIKESIHVGRGAWIGANVTVMPGVSIGRGAVVGAGALVAKDVLGNTLVAGVPARIVRNLD